MVEVVDGNIESALHSLSKITRDAGLPMELRRRQYHMNKSEERFIKEKEGYNRAMATVIRGRINWLIKRRRVK